MTTRQFKWQDVLDSDDPERHPDGTEHEPDWDTLTIAQDFGPFDFPYIPMDVWCDKCGLSGRWGIIVEPGDGSAEAVVWV